MLVLIDCRDNNNNNNNNNNETTLQKIQRTADNWIQKDWFQRVIDDQANAIARAKRNLVSGIKSWIIVEPTERETNYVDEGLSSIFSVGTDNLIDSIEKMETFCQYLCILQIIKQIECSRVFS